MTEPKRHHWWPELQSKQWAGPNGMLNAVRTDGTSFLAPPSKVGVEGELYTRFHLDGTKDREIEKWFSHEIDGPFSAVLARLISLEGIVRHPFPSRGDPTMLRDVQDLGFIVKDYDERMHLRSSERQAIANYLAAMVVRNPIYLTKLTQWHSDNGLSSPRLPPNTSEFRGLALDNMLYLYDLYRQQISKSSMTLTISDCAREFFFSDAGVIAKEPWSNGPIPFDLYAPLTPKIALNVLPIPNPFTTEMMIARVNSQGVSRYNRMTVGGADRFVFTRSQPPIEFITKNFGVPAPSPIGRRWKNGQLETIYDRSRDRKI